MNNWHKFQIICNGLRIASFMTQWQADKFAAERSARWPQNEYRVTTPAA